MAVLAGLGMVLGYLSSPTPELCNPKGHRSPGEAVVAMVLPLAVFALMLGTLLHRFGPVAGVAGLMGAVVTRGLMIRAEPRPRPRGC